jgi:hypothetical protein
MPPVYLAADPLLVDAIALKPLLTRLCSQYQQVYWPSLENDFLTTTRLFADIDNLHTVVWSDHTWEQKWCHAAGLSVIDIRSIPQVCKISLANFPASLAVCVNKHRQIYEYFDMPFSERYHSWRVPSDHLAEQNLYHSFNIADNPYVVVDHSLISNHPTAVQEWRSQQRLPQWPTIVCDSSVNLLDSRLILKQAREIHVGYSSLWTLVDSWHDQIKADLYFHHVDVDNWVQVNCISNQHRWTVVQSSLCS